MEPSGGPRTSPAGLRGDLRGRWRVLLDELGLDTGTGDSVEPGAALGDRLIDRYAEPQRRYHGVSHLAAVLEVLDDLAGDCGPRTTTRLAAWFHDAVHDPTAPDNEARSAVLAADELGTLGLAAGDVAVVAGLVLATAAHDTADDLPEVALLLDADLSVLGAPADVYDRYAAGVREEYRHVPDDAFRRGRAAVLDGFLARPRLFRTEEGRRRFEVAARENLRRELAALTG